MFFMTLIYSIFIFLLLFLNLSFLIIILKKIPRERETHTIEIL